MSLNKKTLASKQHIAIYILLFILGISLIGLYVFIDKSEKAKTDEQELKPLLEESVNKASELFDTIYNDFRADSRNLRQNLEPLISDRRTGPVLHQVIRNHNFWGVSLFRNGEIRTWNGFGFEAPPVSPDIEADSLFTAVLKQNNVILLYGYQTVINEESGNIYELITAERLDQKNVLPIASGQELNLSKHPQLRNLYPVEFSFFTPLTSQPDVYRKLSIAGEDSAGIVFAEYEESDTYFSSFNKQISQIISS
ncbi:MAG: hypothetical protein ACFCU6_11715, partial [Balneolaceae bacterium]